MSFFEKSPALLASIVMVACLSGASAEAQKLNQFKIHQDAPTLTQVDVGAAGRSHGDMLAFEAGLAAADGTKGTLSGILITIDLPGDADLFEDRIGQLVFDLGAPDSIVVAGESIYAEATAEMKADAPQLRAVIGSTGRYLGARGQVTTSRNQDGSYEHAFELIE